MRVDERGIVRVLALSKANPIRCARQIRRLISHPIKRSKIHELRAAWAGPRLKQSIAFEARNAAR
jgi:hypothetical protein